MAFIPVATQWYKNSLLSISSSLVLCSPLESKVTQEDPSSDSCLVRTPTRYKVTNTRLFPVGRGEKCRAGAARHWIDTQQQWGQAVEHRRREGDSVNVVTEDSRGWWGGTGSRPVWDGVKTVGQPLLSF